VDDLEAAVSAVRGQRKAAENQIEELRRVALRLDEEERLLTQLLAVRRGELDSGPLADRAVPRHSDARSINAVAIGQVSHPVVDEVLAYLELQSRPVHISEIMKLLRERQIRIPGSGTDANVISYLRRDNRIDRPSRGMYALSKWGLDSEQPTIVGRRQKRRRSIARVKRD